MSSAELVVGFGFKRFHDWKLLDLELVDFLHHFKEGHLLLLFLKDKLLLHDLPMESVVSEQDDGAVEMIVNIGNN